MDDADIVSKLRRMTGEVGSNTYSDNELLSYVKGYPVTDAWDRKPQNPLWVPTYDFHAAAQDVFEEKAAAVAHRVDFNADGGNYSENQKYESYLKSARYHGARRRAKVKNSLLPSEVLPSV